MFHSPPNPTVDPCRPDGLLRGQIARTVNHADGTGLHYIDSNNVSHGFLRSPTGSEFITFDAPDAGKTAGSGQGTSPDSINRAGAITGHYTDARNVRHGFLRAP